MEINGYQLSRAWFDFCFENPELINTNHTAIYFFAIEHCNRMGWKVKFGFPTQMAMDAIGIKSYHTYIKNFRDLCEWGFIDVIEKSSNQYSANIISIQSALIKKYKASDKALDKAFIKHASKHMSKQDQSTCQSNDSIDKQITINQLNQEPINNITSTLSGIFLLEEVQKAWQDWEQYRKEKKQKLTPSTAKKQMDFLGGRAGPEAIAIINQSILNGWTGLFELKTNANGVSAKNTRSAEQIEPERKYVGKL